MLVRVFVVVMIIVVDKGLSLVPRSSANKENMRASETPEQFL